MHLVTMTSTCLPYLVSSRPSINIVERMTKEFGWPQGCSAEDTRVRWEAMAYLAVRGDVGKCGSSTVSVV